MKLTNLIFLSLIFVCGPVATANTKGGSAPKPVKLTEQKKEAEGFASPHFKNLLKRYQNSLGVRMAFSKRAYFPLLKKSQSSTGEIFLSKKKILLTLKDHLNTQVLFDGKKWWHIVAPYGEAKRVSAIKPDQNISLLFQPEMFFQNFRFASQETKGRTQILNFLPKSKSSPIGSLTVQVEQNRILKVWLKWQGSNNEEVFSFSNIRFNQKLPSSLFIKPN